jgi:hypothetical protein
MRDQDILDQIKKVRHQDEKRDLPKKLEPPIDINQNQFELDNLDEDIRRAIVSIDSNQIEFCPRDSRSVSNMTEKKVVDYQLLTG